MDLESMIKFYLDQGILLSRPVIIDFCAQNLCSKPPRGRGFGVGFAAKSVIPCAAHTVQG